MELIFLIFLSVILYLNIISIHFSICIQEDIQKLKRLIRMTETTIDDNETKGKDKNES